ncbi:MAG: thermonuclease family protein [Acidimicrobiia bacterium]
MSACEHYGQSGSTDASLAPERLESSLVTRVNDGDSIVVDVAGEEVEVRLVGINSPESDECFYQEAADHLSDLIEGNTVEVEVTGTDQFGRTLGHVWLDDSSLSFEQVAAGLAIATSPGEGETRSDELMAAEEKAFSDQVGLWGRDVCGASGPLPDVSIDGPGSRFDPAGPDQDVLDEEWVRLESRDMADLGGWTVRDESSAHRCSLPEGHVMAPGGDFDVTSSDPCWDPGQTPVWNNGGDMALLLDPAGRVVARHRYHG